MKSLLKKYLLTAFCLFFTINSLAAPSTISYIRYWSALIKNGSFGFNPHLLYSGLIEGRFTNQPGLFYQGLAQAQLGYQVAPHASVWLGYVWMPTTMVGSNGRTTTYNQRIFEQLSTTFVDSPSNLWWSRARMEERQQNGNAQISWRFREDLEWEIRSLTIHHHYTPFVSNEIFFNVNEPNWVNQNFVNQNRFMTGVDFPCFGHSICRVAYLNQYVIQHPTNVMSHILYTSLTF